jgi:hypothetical protein
VEEGGVGVPLLFPAPLESPLLLNPGTVTSCASLPLFIATMWGVGDRRRGVQGGLARERTANCCCWAKLEFEEENENTPYGLVAVEGTGGEAWGERCWVDFLPRSQPSFSSISLSG